MHFKKTLSLAFNTYSVHIKSLLIQLLAVAFAAAIVALFFVNAGGRLVEKIKEEKIIEQATEIVEAVVDGKTAEEDDFDEKIVGFMDSVKEIFTAVPNLVEKAPVAVWLFILLVYAMYFFFGLTLYNNMFVINKFASTNVLGFYLWAYVKEFKNNVRLNWAASLLCCLMDTSILMTIVGVYVVAFSGWGVVGVVVSVLLLVFLMSLRRTVLAYWVPAFVTEECGVSDAFKKGVGMMLDDFGKLLLKTFIVIFVAVALCILSMLVFSVVWSGVVITLICLLAGHYLTCAYVVDYYEQSGKTYFTKKVDLAALTGDGENTLED